MISPLYPSCRSVLTAEMNNGSSRAQKMTLGLACAVAIASEVEDVAVSGICWFETTFQPFCWDSFTRLELKPDSAALWIMMMPTLELDGSPLLVANWIIGPGSSPTSVPAAYTYGSTGNTELFGVPLDMIGVSLPAATGAAATSTLLSSAPVTLTWSWLMNVLTFATPCVGVDLSSSTFR